MKEIQKRIQEQTLGFQAAMKAREMDSIGMRGLIEGLNQSAAMKMAEIDNLGIQRLVEEMNQSSALMRAALGPTQDLRKMLHLSGVEDVAMQFDRLSKEMESRYWLPEIGESVRLFNESINVSFAKAIECYGQESAAIRRAMEDMRTPWIDINHQIQSITGLAKLQGIGHLLATRPAFGVDVVAALRLDLGDWRDEVVWPEVIFSDPVARVSFYEERGVDPALTSFPAEAFHRGIEIAGLTTSLPDPIADEEDPAAFRRTNAAHAYLTRLERDLRWFIDRQMRAIFGEAWIKHRVPGELQKAWLDKKERAKESGEPDRALIEYADFMDYEQIILRRDNWNAVFKPFFNRQTSVQESFRRLYPVRNCTMHARLLVQEDELLLFAEITRLSRAMK